MKKKLLYIFDMDGTLFNTLGDLSAAVNYALSAFGLKKLSTEKIKSYIGNGSLKLIERSLEGAQVPLDAVHKCYSCSIYSRPHKCKVKNCIQGIKSRKEDKCSNQVEVQVYHGRTAGILFGSY